MRHGHAEAERPHATQAIAAHSTPKLISDHFRAPVIPCVQAIHILEGVGAPTPACGPEIDAVVQAVILEGREQLPFEGVPQAQLGRDVAIEVGQQRAAIAALRRRGKTQEQARTNALDECLVGGRRNVVTLVDDHVIPVVGAKALEQATCVEALYGREEMLEPGRVTAAGEELAEGFVAKDMAERVTRLSQELFAVCEEEESRSQRRLTHLPLIVERRDNRLARSGGSHDQVAPPPM